MKVEFYVLPTTQTADRLNAACRLAHKAWRAGFMTFIRCSDAAQQTELDALLWTFRKPSFIPHELHSENASAPVVIGLNEQPHFREAVLINLHQDISTHLDCFIRVIEIVNQEPELLQVCRQNFVRYRELGYQPARVEL